MLLVLLLAGCSTDPPAVDPSPSTVVPFAGCAGLGPGQAELPEVSLPCFAGGESVQMRQLRGPAVVNFWASWCEPCRAELPAFQRLSELNRVSVVGVATDDRRESAIALADDLGLKIPTLFDSSGELRRALGEPNLPLTLFIDSSGKVTKYVGPALTDEKLAELVRERLGVA